MKAYNHNSILVLVCLLTMMSCAAPLLTNSDRGKYKVASLDLNQTVLAVNVSVLPLPESPEKAEEKAKTFFNLSDSVKIAYLKAVAQKATSTSEIPENIKAKLSVVEKAAAPTPTKRIDQNNIKVRFLFSNIKKYYNDDKLLHPNTRLEFLNTTLSMDPDKAFIYSIDRLENEFEQIDMGTLGRTQEVKFTTTLTGEAGSDVGFDKTSTTGANDSTSSSDENETSVFDEDGNKIGSFKTKPGSTHSNTSSTINKQNSSTKLSAKGELQYANTQNIKEELQVKFKKIKTSFSFTPRQLTVSQRGRPLSDISDNVFVTATLKVPNIGRLLDNKTVNKFDKLRLEDYSVQSVDKVERSKVSVTYIPCSSARDIDISVSYEGAIRAVDNLRKGRNTLEFDDQLTYYKFRSPPQSVPITINKNEICNNVFFIIATFEGDSETYFLRQDNVERKQVMLYDEHGPNAFVSWMSKLVADTTPASKAQLESKKGDLFFERNAADRKRIYFSKETMSAEDLNKLKTIRSIVGKVVQ